MTTGRDEQAVAALETAAKEKLRRRSATLPGEKEWCDLLAIFYSSPERLAPVEAAAAKGVRGVVELVAGLPICPGAEAMRGVLVGVLEAAGGKDSHRYRRLLGSLRLALLELFAAVGYRWRRHWQGRSLIELPMQPAPITTAKGWGLAMLAGRAVEMSSFKLGWWIEWMQGRAAKMHAFYTYEMAHGRPTIKGVNRTPAELWRDDCSRRRLPAEEEAVLIGRGLATREQVDAVSSLPTIPPDGERDVDRAIDAVIEAAEAAPLADRAEE
ncbi:MAG: hypothetical protein ABSD48_18325 [Armatimonadota bacterium]